MPKITPIPARRFCRLLEKAGFELVRTEGDHMVYRKPGVTRPCVIPDWQDLPVFIIKNNLRSAGISRDEYFRLLEQVYELPPVCNREPFSSEGPLQRFISRKGAKNAKKIIFSFAIFAPLREKYLFPMLIL